jgi:hypothetical protein
VIREKVIRPLVAASGNTVPRTELKNQARVHGYEPILPSGAGATRENLRGTR